MSDASVVLLLGQLILLMTTIGTAWLKDRRDKELRVASAAREVIMRAEQLEDRRDAQRQATAERDAATASIISTAKAEAEATRIKTESVAANLRMVGEHTAENLRLSNALAAAQAREETRIAAETVRIEAEHAARRIRENSATEAMRIRDEQAKQNRLIVEKIEESTAASKAAEVEANHSNLKIAETKAELVQLNQRLLEQEKASGESAKRTQTQMAALATHANTTADIGQETHDFAAAINLKVHEAKKP